MDELASKREELAAKQKRLHDIFEEARTSEGKLDLKAIKSLDGDNAAKQAEIKRLNEELNELGREVETLVAQKNVSDLGKRLNEPTGFQIPTPQPQAKSFGELFTESVAYKERGKGQGPSATLEGFNAKALVYGDIGLKTTMTEAAGFAPQAIRTGLIVPFATRPLQVLDNIPAQNTSMNAIVYMEETTFTNNAAETSENAAYPESALAFTERTSNVRKVATFIPVTDEQLEDVPFIQGYLNDRLTFMVRQRLDQEVLVGNGTAPNLLGIKNVSGIQTQAKGADTALDAIYKAMVNVRLVGRAIPDLIAIHPTDWQNIRLTKTTTGEYVFGDPQLAGMDQAWGLRVALTDADTAGTAYVGDFRDFSFLAYRHDVDVQVGYINDDFKLGKKSVRADLRAAFVVSRPAAFCLVTGL